MRKVLITWLLCCVSYTYGMSIAPSMEFEYNASIVANDIYNMFWTTTSEDITIELHVKTLGYVGFGLSKKGGMKGADIVIGWVKDGEVFFQDRHSNRNAEPVIDESQDWKILEGKEVSEYTILRFSRDLTNCDPNDMDITDGTMRLIYAFHEDDPVEATGLQYHKSQRGTKSMYLLSHLEQEARTIPDDAFPMDFRMEEVQVPAADTTYYCRGFKIPVLDKKHHVIQAEPLITPGHEGLVHHMILYACLGEFDADLHDGRNDVCRDERMKEIESKCYSSLFLYGIGEGYTYLPLNTGIPLGGENSITFFKLEIHYDNPPPSQTGLVDSSGLRLWLTPTLRKYDSWILSTGLSVNEYHIIPPHFDGLTNYGYCPGSCLSAGMESSPETADGITIYAAALHTHLIGASLRLRHFRNGQELKPIAEDDHYDFNFQYMKFLKEPVQVKPGDDLIVECTYDSKDRDSITFGGDSTREEMCLIFILYYPRMSHLTNCVSMMPPASFMKYTNAEIISNNKKDADDITIVGEQYSGKDWRQIVQDTNWTDATTKDNFQKAILDNKVDQVMICDGKEDFLTVEKPSEMNNIYFEEDKCGGPSSGSSRVSGFFSMVVFWQILMLARTI